MNILLIFSLNPVKKKIYKTQRPLLWRLHSSCFASMTANNVQVLFLIYGVTYVTGVLGPLVFLFIYRQCLACRYFYWSTVDICNWCAETPGLHIHLPQVSSLQVLLFIFGEIYVMGLLCLWSSSSSTASVWPASRTWSKVWHVTGVLGPLVFLFIYRQCLACRYCTWIKVWHVTGVLGPLVFLFIYRQRLAYKYFHWSTVWHTVCDGGARTPGLPLHQSPVSGLQVLYLIRCYICHGGAGTPGLPLHLPPVSSLQALTLIYGVTYVTGFAGTLEFLFIYS